MAKLTLKKALTDVTVYLFVQDSSKTTGEGLTGLAYNTANLVASYVRPLGSRTAITLATLAAVDSAHSDGGFKEIDATNMPGVYRLDLPDAVCATGVPSAVVMLKGASNMTPVLLEIQLTDFDLNSTSNTVGTVTNLTNLPSIPNNWLTAAGIAADAGAEIADAVWDEAISGHTTAGSFGAKNQKVVPSETIGDYKADVSSLATSAALATVGSNVTSIKTKTDNLPASPAAVGSAMTLSDNAITAAVIATDAIDADSIKADAITEIQAGLATPTNITAGTITTVTNLTNLPAMPNDWLTAAGVKADAVTKIATAVWGNATRTLSSFGTLIADIWGHATRTLSAFAFTVTGAKDTSIDAIKAKTDTIPASPAAVGSAMTLSDNAITAAVIATDAIDADAIKADAVSEIQSGLATASALATVAGYVDDLEGRLTATRAGYLDKLNVSGTLAHSDAAATYKADVSGIPAAVWGHATRTLSSFGTLVSDIWSAATRTLSAFAFTVTGAKDASIDAIKAKTDTIPASPAAVGSAMTLTVGERTAIANEVESQIIDDTDAEKVLKAITDKIASVNPSLDDLTLAGIASAVRTELTTELARIDAAISTRLATAGYTAPANADISTIKSKTDNLPASPAASGEYTSALSAIQADLDNPNQYKADVSGLALEATLTAIKGATWTDETLVGLMTAIEGISAGSGASVADILNALLASYTVSGSVGEALGRLDNVQAKTDLITTGTSLTIASAVSGSTITAHRGDTLSAALTNIGALTNNSKLWFTVKRDYDDADTAAVIQIEKTGGLLYLNGAVGTAGNGSLTINDEATGDVTIVLNASETAKLSPGNYQYDIQILRSAGTPVSTLTYGEFVVPADVTRATA